jgi:hypothetical protein
MLSPVLPVWRLRSGSLCLSFGYGSVETKEALNLRHLQGLADALVHGDEPEAPSVLLSRNVGADQSADSSRVSQSHLRKIENQGARLVRTDRRLESEHVGKGQRSGKAQDTDSLSRTGHVFDVQRLIRHVEMLRSNEQTSVKSRLIPASAQSANWI